MLEVESRLERFFMATLRFIRLLVSDFIYALVMNFLRKHMLFPDFVLSGVCTFIGEPSDLNFIHHKGYV